MRRYLFTLAFVLAVLPAGCEAGARDAVGGPTAAASLDAVPKPMPLDMAAHVEALARAGRLEEARVWWYRGATRSLILDSLAEVYAEENFEGAVTANILKLSEVDVNTLAQLQMSALEWEATTPLDLPKGFPRDRMNKLPELRAQLAIYLRKGVEAERQRRAATDVLKGQVSANQPTDEQIAIVSSSDRLISPAGAVSTDCNFGMNFASSDATAGLEGKLVAIRVCNELRIIDISTRATVQSLNELTSRHQVLAVYPEPNDVSLLTFQEGPASDTNTGFHRTTSKAVTEKMDLPLPARIGARSMVTIARSVASADGRVVVVEMCVDRPCAIFAAYDLASHMLTWQGGKPDQSHERLIASIAKIGQDYVLVSELRPTERSFAGADATEMLNLTTGIASRTDIGTLGIHQKPDGAPKCNLKERAGANGDMSFEYEVAWPSGRAPTALHNPPRAPVSDCTVSPDGKALIVIVAPFIYRYEFRG